MFMTEQLQEKWSPVLDSPGMPTIQGNYKRSVITKLLEAQEGDNRLQRHQNMLMEDAPANNMGGGADTGGIGKFDPILISLVRRALPNLMAFDVAGVQPLSGPTGIIFAMRSLYGSDRSLTGRTEALFKEANSAFSGTGTQTGTNPGATGSYTYGSGMSTAAAEALGTASNPAFSEMSFTIEKTTVTAKTRALKAEYSVELAQDLKAIHGLDAEGELSNILSQEITFEMNRELIRRMYTVAKAGAQTTTTPGVFDLDVDSNGRWSVERFKGLLYQIERDANIIAQDTRRGKGNFIVCSADVASALKMAGVLDTAPALQMNNGLQVDDMGNTFCGMLFGTMKVFVDPYSANFGATDQYYMVGYRGQSAWDAGIYYCPYIPLQMHRAVDPNSFQPKIAFKTRYGMIANPFVTTADTSTGMNVPDGEAFTANRNQYFRRVTVRNLL